jgi:hypothetical protein
MLDRLLDLFRAPDPTSTWPPARERSLTLDLETGALSGIRPGAPWTDLADWGRPANPRPVARSRFVYPGMGVAILLVRERVAAVDVQFQERDVFGHLNAGAVAQGFVPARLRMVGAGGSEMLVTLSTTPDDVRGRLGRAGVDECPEWLGLLYVRAGWEVEFEFDADRALSLVSITYHDGATA